MNHYPIGVAPEVYVIADLLQMAISDGQVVGPCVAYVLIHELQIHWCSRLVKSWIKESRTCISQRDIIASPTTVLSTSTNTSPKPHDRIKGKSVTSNNSMTAPQNTFRNNEDK